jgi:pyruvate dehydrogenase E1 component alpha subunit
MTLTREQAVEAFRRMLLIRRFEEKSAELYSAGKIRGFLHLYIGEEAVAVGSLMALGDADNIVATYREHGHALARGTPAGSIMAEMYGKANGCSRGRGGSMHLFDVERRFYGGNAIVAGGLPLAVGLALADVRLSRPAVTACYFGDGAVDEGEFHESLNLAALWRLPVLFLCENNRYAMGTALERHESVTDLCIKPRGYGIEAHAVDGMDLLAVLAATERVVTQMRETRKPYFLELQTYRFRAHSMYDAELYRSKEEVRDFAALHDPLRSFEEWLHQAHGFEASERAALEASVAQQVEAAVLEAEQGELEPIEQLTRDVYTEPA